MIRRGKLLVLIATALFGSAACENVQSDTSSYLDVVPVFWKELYDKGGKTLYCGIEFGRQSRLDTNIEHVYPMSWVVKELGCRDRAHCRRTVRMFNVIEADMHNLYPSLRRINEARGSKPFGEIKGEERRFGGCDFEVQYRPHRIEPRPAARGEIARAMLYMADRYKLPIFKKQLKLLKHWHRQDQPSKVERRRNDIIESVQGRRNPFIDDPSLAARVR